jgi:hypothetical protein
MSLKSKYPIKFIKYLIQDHCHDFSVTNIAGKEECIVYKAIRPKA